MRTKNLERRHERRRARSIQHLGNAHLREIKIVQAEVADISGDKVLQESLAALVTKENFVANKHVRRDGACGRNFRGEISPLTQSCQGRQSRGVAGLRRKVGHSESLHDVADQAAGKILDHALQRRSFFFKKAGDFSRDLILLRKV